MTECHAALILTRSGKCLVHCAVGAYAQRPTLKVGPLCQLLTAMQEMAGRPESSFMELHGCGVTLVVAHGVVVDWREPAVIRMAPVPLYNSFEDMVRFSHVLETGLTELAGRA